MPAHRDDAACTGAGVRKPSGKETAIGRGGWCGLHYGDLNAAAEAPEGRRGAAGVGRRGYGSTSEFAAPVADAGDFWAI